MIDVLRKMEKESIEGKSGSIRDKRSILNFLFAGKQKHILKRREENKVLRWLKNEKNSNSNYLELIFLENQ